MLDMLAQCEADEKDGKGMTTNRPRGPKVCVQFEGRGIEVGYDFVRLVHVSAS